jgi:hypothetical protein
MGTSSSSSRGTVNTMGRSHFQQILAFMILLHLQFGQFPMLETRDSKGEADGRIEFTDKLGDDNEGID